MWLTVFTTPRHTDGGMAVFPIAMGPLLPLSAARLSQVGSRYRSNRFWRFGVAQEPSRFCGNPGGSFLRIRHNRTGPPFWKSRRSEEHTSELQSLRHLVCRLL